MTYKKAIVDHRKFPYAETKFDHKKAIMYFKFIRSQSKVAKKFGVSRERIRQIVKRYNPELKPRTKDRPTQCIRCKKGVEEVKHITYRGYCSACSQSKDREIRVVETVCRVCKLPLNENRSPYYAGICGKCVYKTNHNGFRDRHKIAQKKARLKHPEKYRARCREAYRQLKLKAGLRPPISKYY